MLSRLHIQLTATYAGASLVLAILVDIVQSFKEHTGLNDRIGRNILLVILTLQEVYNGGFV